MQSINITYVVNIIYTLNIDVSSKFIFVMQILFTS